MNDISLVQITKASPGQFLVFVFLLGPFAHSSSVTSSSKFGYGSARGDPDVWNGLDHLRFGMDRGYGSACGFKVWIGALHFNSQPSPNSWLQPLFHHQFRLFLMFSLRRCSRSTPSHFPLFLFLTLLASQFLYNFVFYVALFVRQASPSVPFFSF